MNKVILLGRLTKSPEIRYSSGQTPIAVCRYTLAVARQGKKASDQEASADFINCTAFGARGEFASKYFKKGTQIAVVGELRTGSYQDKQGNKRYTTEVMISEQFFAETKERSTNQEPDFAGTDTRRPGKRANEDFIPISGLYEGADDLPF